MNEIKFTVFSDLHYLPGVFYTDAEKRLDAIYERAVSSGSDFMIHLGDISHEPDKVPEFIKHYDSFDIPTYHCIGNHEPPAFICGNRSFSGLRGRLAI